MQKKDSRTGITLFVIGVMIAGACNAFARFFTLINYDYESVGGTELPFFSTLLFALNIAVYLFLMIYWILSVHERLLPSRTRSYVIGAGICMVYFVLYHAIKYRVFEGDQLPVMRFMWYSFYVPLIFIPTLLLMTSIRISKKDETRGFDERLLLIPAVVLSLLIMTNTLHTLAFVPLSGNGFDLSGNPQTYSYGFLYYAVYAYVIITAIAALVFLTKANGKTRKPLRIAAPFLLVLMIPVMIVVNKVMVLFQTPQPFLFVDMAALYAIAVFENCIRGRLIPYNNDYIGLFGKMTLPAVISDKNFNRVYETAEPVKATHEELEHSVSQPVYSDSNTRLEGKAIKTGYVFRTEDEAELHKSERRLREANDKLAEENNFIQAENRLREEKARVQFHNEVFEKIADHIRPAQARAVELSENLDQGSEDFDKKAARILAIDSYIKRCINLMLKGKGEEFIRTSELMRAFNESTDYLGFCGLDAVVINRTGEQIKTETAIAFYDCFELISQEMIDNAGEMEITVFRDRMEIKSDFMPELGKLPLSLSSEKTSDGFLLVISGKEDEND